MMRDKPSHEFRLTPILSLALGLAIGASIATASAAPRRSAPFKDSRDWKPQKKLDFNNALVETLDRPLNSLSQLSEAEKDRRRPHLYRKRTEFNAETAETLHQTRFN